MTTCRADQLQPGDHFTLGDEYEGTVNAVRLSGLPYPRDLELKFGGVYTVDIASDEPVEVIRS